MLVGEGSGGCACFVHYGYIFIVLMHYEVKYGVTVGKGFYIRRLCCSGVWFFEALRTKCVVNPASF